VPLVNPADISSDLADEPVNTGKVGEVELKHVDLECVVKFGDKRGKKRPTFGFFDAAEIRLTASSPRRRSRHPIKTVAALF